MLDVRCTSRGGTTPANELHPEDVAAMGERLDPSTPLRQDICNSIATLFKQRFGRGPLSCRTYLETDLVVVVLSGGYTAGEQTMFEEGKWHGVRHARLAWHDSMEARFVEAIERLTHRTVSAFTSAGHQSSDLTVELFVLSPWRLGLARETEAQRHAAGVRRAGRARCHRAWRRPSSWRDSGTCSANKP
jgi:uncharacterized protein YbcI